jgi:hypothetical protein
LYASSTAETTTTAVPTLDVDCKKVKQDCIGNVPTRHCQHAIMAPCSLCASGLAWPVSQYERRVEVYSRDAQGLWVLREARAGGAVPLSALSGAALVLDNVYEGVELEPRPPRDAS